MFGYKVKSVTNLLLQKGQSLHVKNLQVPGYRKMLFLEEQRTENDFL